MDKRLNDWCDEVLAQVRFRMDHNAIRAELEAHMEDRCAALEELNYPPELAAERTLKAMGDPAVVGKALDKEHSPWLGWCWIVSVVAVFLMAVVVVIEVQESHATLGRFWDRIVETVAPTPPEEMWPELDENFDAQAAYGFDYTCIGVSSAGAVDAGKWTVEIPKAVWWDRFDKYTYVAILLTVTPDMPWYGCEFENINELLMLDSNGNYNLGSSAKVNFAKSSGFPWYSASYASHSLVQGKYFIGVTIKGDADWLEFTWPYGDHPWTLRVEKEGAA